ncbi:hypothetical protein, partial [Salmonella enterica]|uniref:hypothetical protein n=1 Tax=Salmonella enterica TaxID=28901 RepID=UPI001C3DF12C
KKRLPAIPCARDGPETPHAARASAAAQMRTNADGPYMVERICGQTANVFCCGRADAARMAGCRAPCW